MAPHNLIPLKAFAVNRGASGTDVVTKAPEGFLLEISNIQLTMWGAGILVPRVPDDLTSLNVRLETDVMPFILMCRGHDMAASDAHVNMWQYDAGPPVTYMALGYGGPGGVQPGFVSVQAAGPFVFGPGTDLWFSATLVTAGVNSSCSLLYRFLPIPEPEIAEALPAPAATQPFPFAWQRMVPGVS